ncbi:MULTISPECIES: TolC family outer membrane protein [Cupriavidus]
MTRPPLSVRRRAGLAWLCGAALALAAPGAAALGLMQAYALALENDPVYLAARSDREAGEENREIARAALLPRASWSYNNAPRNWQNARYPATDLFGRTREVDTDRTYRSYGSVVTVRQPLFDLEAWHGYRQGDAQAEAAERLFASRAQELAVRLLEAYSQALYAQDQLALAGAQRAAYEAQLRTNLRLFERGEGTRTDIAETRSRASLAQAQELAARDALAAALHTLAAMLGEPQGADGAELEALRAGAAETPLAPLAPPDFEAWRRLALDNNPALQAQRHAVEAAAREVQRDRAGHLPRVELYASWSQNRSDTANTYNQAYRTGSVGMQLTVPLYAGGGIAATTRQAAARLQSAQHNLDAQTRATVNSLREQFDLCQSSAARIAAYEDAVAAAETQIAATRKSIAGGERVNLDLLNAEQQRFVARRDLANARYGYLQAWLRLRWYAGTLGEAELRHVAGQFGPRPTGAAPALSSGPRPAPARSAAPVFPPSGNHNTKEET